MATIARPAAPLHGIASVFRRIFSTIGETLVTIGEANARMRAFERLQSMTDEQLAARGLKREELVHYVFRGCL